MAYLQKIKLSTGNGDTYHNMTHFLYGTCASTAGTATKVVTCADMGALEDGVTIFVKFTYGNSIANIKLDVNGTGAKDVYYNGSSKPVFSENPWDAGAVVAFTYDGTKWIIDHSVLAAVRKDISITIPAGQTTYAYTDSWITTETTWYYHDLETKNLTTTVSWSSSGTTLTFTLGEALSSDLTFNFGLIKNVFA